MNWQLKLHEAIASALLVAIAGAQVPANAQTPVPIEPDQDLIALSRLDAEAIAKDKPTAAASAALDTTELDLEAASPAPEPTPLAAPEFTPDTELVPLDTTEIDLAAAGPAPELAPREPAPALEPARPVAEIAPPVAIARRSDSAWLSRELEELERVGNPDIAVPQPGSAEVAAAGLQGELPPDASSSVETSELDLLAPERELFDAERPLPPVPEGVRDELEELEREPRSTPDASELFETIRSNDLGQVNSVSRFLDVAPSDWAYQALSELVERYNCLAGYPDGSFRGDRALSRYEFAAGLNACVQQVERLIAESTADLVTFEDLEVVQRLIQEFEAEIATLDTRVDDLDGRVAFLEDNQFSATTKLFGQAIVGIQGRTDNDFEALLSQLPDQGTETNLITNVQLSLFSQFSPTSLLFTGLQAGSGNTISGNFTETFVGLAYEGDTNNDVVLNYLNYRHLIADKIGVVVGPLGVNATNVFRGSNEIESAGYGPLSRFAQRNPIIAVGAGTGGIGADWQVFDRLSVQAVYSTSLPNDSELGGIFGGDQGLTSIGLQAVASPLDTLDVALQYINSYSPSGRLGTGVGDDLVVVPTVTEDDILRGPIQTNAFGVSADWNVLPAVTVGGWFGYTTSAFQPADGSVETLNWMGYLNFPDLFGEGNLGALFFGMPPKITSSDLPTGRNVPNTFLTTETEVLAGNLGSSGGQPDTALHLEAVYRWRLSNNVTITPGAIVLFNPGHNANNSTIFIGAVRTTFAF